MPASSNAARSVCASSAFGCSGQKPDDSVASREPWEVSNSNNTTINGGGGNENDVCASYVRNGQTIQGTADGNGNCTYGSAFVASAVGASFRSLTSTVSVSL